MLALCWPLLDLSGPYVAPMFAYVSRMLAHVGPMLARLQVLCLEPIVVSRHMFVVWSSYTVLVMDSLPAHVVTRCKHQQSKRKVCVQCVFPSRRNTMVEAVLPQTFNIKHIIMLRVFLQLEISNIIHFMLFFPSSPSSASSSSASSSSSYALR